MHAGLGNPPPSPPSTPHHPPPTSCEAANLTGVPQHRKPNGIKLVLKLQKVQNPFENFNQDHKVFSKDFNQASTLNLCPKKISWIEATPALLPS